jgi:hypothetical protein
MQVQQFPKGEVLGHVSGREITGVAKSKASRGVGTGLDTRDSIGVGCEKRELVRDAD